MENAEEILQCLDEFAKLKPKDIPRELEEYLCFVAKTGDPVYQWPLIKCLFREKLINVITEFYETCPTVEIPPCPNVDAFNYDAMKNFILEKLDTFAAAPFTVQRICELLTSPRKEYNRIDKYMRALEKNILVVSTREPGNRKSTENGENVVNGLESEHVPQEVINSDVNVEVEMDESSEWQKSESVSYSVNETIIILESQPQHATDSTQDTYVSESKISDTPACSSSVESVITSRPIGYIGYTPNITDLIIEPSTVSNNSETATPTPPTAEVTDPAPQSQNLTVFAMNTEQIEATKYTEPLPDTKSITKIIEPVKSSVYQYVKAYCAETGYSSMVQLEPGPEPEPSLAQMEAMDKNPGSKVPLETKSEPISPPSDNETEEPCSSDVLPQPSVQIEPEPSQSTAQMEPESSEPSSETTISSSDEAPVNSSIVQTSSADSAVSGTSEDQVSASNIESEESALPTEESALPTEESREESSSMQVDEIPVSSDTTEVTEEPQEVVEEAPPVAEEPPKPAEDPQSAENN